jgi:hypothetical protein
MGKKMGINTKAVEARERKEAQKKAKQEAAERQKEEEAWRDDDKHVNRKISRQREREIKAQQERDRKAALKAAYEQEMELAEKSAKAKSKQATAVVEVPKVTRHEIQKTLETEQEQLSKQLKKVNLDPLPLVPNLNRLEEEGESASTIDQALDLLKSHSTTANPTKGVKGSSKKC